MSARTFLDLVRVAESAPREPAAPVGNPFGPLESTLGQKTAAVGQIGAVPTGSLTGAPARTILRTVRVAPGVNPTLVVEATRESRVVTLTAPAVAFSIFIGNSAVNTGVGLGLTSALPYDLILPGNQDIYAVSDAPVFLILRVQIASILIGDRERPAPGIFGNYGGP